MHEMFYKAYSFNQPIASLPNRWNVSKVRNFYGFLRAANSFNHPVSGEDLTEQEVQKYVGNVCGLLV